MKIGIPKEIKNHEYRVGLLPGSVQELIHHGHHVTVETGAGAGIGFLDEAYQLAGADIVSAASDVFSAADMIVKVKEPLEQERALLRSGQTLFTYLHLAPDQAQTRDLINSEATCIAYETVTDTAGRLPLLAPMSEVAGRMSIQAGAMCLEKSHGGSGILLGGVPGSSQAKVVILGGGVVGRNATMMAVGMGARVTVIDRNLDALRHIDECFGNRVQTLFSTRETVHNLVLDADLVIGSVLIPGASAPKLISKDMIKAMRPGSVLVDVAIDQGGCSETSTATTHAEPTYLVNDVVHYCVANMPGAVARTSSLALNNATLPFVLELADKGTARALQDNAHLLNGLNVCRGKVTNASVAQAHDMACHDGLALLS
ncbi:MAG: alanine dehydrogenase [Gammaproteobacteria bacterium]|jgi:alanine dehydrogenase|nr:alanine dehydrogenase [Gammaproteobacteria bacterium]MBT5201858.1 alanine dehydrogenase [Gammaproteobacteria bacterium]MBT5602626.1 alanine dehydrogenase [Gammaproteobacteria bacterium]MBT6244206.1 alanine dehydrogenase [Gammaproteobacteria bacterium]